MKYLIYELFSGVGFCNQLFSLETSIYLANVSKRKLVLLIRNPLCHCGVSSWDYGKFLDFFSDDYKEFLPFGLDVYYGAIPPDINNILQDKNKCYYLKFINRFSQIVIVDKNLDNISNSNNIESFLSGRTKCTLDINEHSHEYLYINQSNASRCFYNFYTTLDNYKLMSKICQSLTKLHKSFSHVFNLIEIPKKYISIHFRFGDSRHQKYLIDKRSEMYYKPLTDLISRIKSKYNEDLQIVIMCDRMDAQLLVKLQEKYNIIYTSDVIKDINYKSNFINFKKTEVIEFLMQKLISDKSEIFIGHDGSTVSNYINYIHYLSDKPYFYYLNKEIHYSFEKCTWNYNNYVGGGIGWRVFFSDNINKPNTKLITLTNNGYCHLTQNLLESMKKIGIEQDLKIYCIGEKCYHYFKKLYCYNEIVQVDVEDDFLQEWIEYKSAQNPDIEGKKRWASITSYKMCAINNELMKDNNVIFVDGDIVMEKNPIQFLTDNIGDNDLLIQNDNQDYASRAMCTGLFLIKSNDKTKNITDFKTISENIDNFTNDQQYLRRYEKQLKVKYLELDLFPNGKYYREKNPSNPYLIHFNYDVSEHKVRRMKMFNKWYLNENIIVEPPKLCSSSSSIIKKNTTLQISEKIETDLEISKYIESKGIKLRQGYITQVKKHETMIIESIRKYFGNLKTIKNVLEIGFLGGHSADLFLKLNDTLTVHSFDLGAFQSVDVGKKYIDQLYPTRHVLIKGDSKQTIPSFIDKNKINFDIILIDGGYDYETVLTDLNNCKQLANTKTLLIVNNVLNNQKWIKYWNKEPTHVWNKLIKEKKVVEKIKNIDIDIGRGSVIGKYNFDNYLNKENLEQKKKNTVRHIVIHSKRTAGFYSNLLGIIYNAYVHIVDGKVPYILWENPKYMGNKGDNIFNYFFEQPQIEVTHNDKIIIENGIRCNEIIKMAQFNKLSFREQMHKMYNLVCKVKPEFMDKFDEYTKKLNLNNLDAFHMRKTDRYIGGKGLIYAGPNQDTIESYIESNSLYSFYLATDCKNTFSYFNNKYDCCSYAEIRSSGTIGIHNSNEINPNNKIMAEEAFIESYLLSRCKTLHRVTSNFTVFSLIVNPKLPFVDLSCMFKDVIIKEHKLNDIYLEDFLLK